LLITEFYTGLNEILKAVTGEELSQLEVEVLKFLVGWSYWRHLTLEHFTFTPKHIAKHLHAKRNEITKAIEKLKRLGLLEDCNS
jgi:predicted transcriptional regulator